MTLVVYKLTCTKNNKIYVGITNNLNGRWNKHVYDTKHGSSCVIHRAMRKYDINNFILSIIQICENKTQLLEREQFFIKQLQSHVSVGGYNETWGGEAPMLGMHHSALTKMKIRNKLKGRVSPNKGNKVSLKTKKIMSKKHSKKVLQLDCNGNIIKIFSSIKEASLSANIAGSNISGVCRGKKKTAGGYCWKYFVEASNA